MHIRASPSPIAAQRPPSCNYPDIRLQDSQLENGLLDAPNACTVPSTSVHFPALWSGLPALPTCTPEVVSCSPVLAHDFRARLSPPTLQKSVPCLSSVYRPALAKRHPATWSPSSGLKPLLQPGLRPSSGRGSPSKFISSLGTFLHTRTFFSILSIP